MRESISEPFFYETSAVGFHARDLPSPKGPWVSDGYQFLLGLTVGVQLCDPAGVLFWQPIQIDGDAYQ